jgi:hypothetical protein
MLNVNLPDDLGNVERVFLVNK